MPNKPDTADRLRQDIDHGEAGDKVNFVDPAAAPLGTDDEAAGTPPTKEQVRRAHAQEVRDRPADRTAGRPDRDALSFRDPNWRWALPLITIVIAGFVAVALVAFV